MIHSLKTITQNQLPGISFNSRAVYLTFIVELTDWQAEALKLPLPDKPFQRLA